MKNIASLFTPVMHEALKSQLDVELSDEYDYSEDELALLYERITNEFPFNYADDEGGRPLGITVVMEDMIDVFTKNKLIAFG